MWCRFVSCFAKGYGFNEDKISSSKYSEEMVAPSTHCFSYWCSCVYNIICHLVSNMSWCILHTIDFELLAWLNLSHYHMEHDVFPVWSGRQQKSVLSVKHEDGSYRLVMLIRSIVLFAGSCFLSPVCRQFNLSTLLYSFILLVICTCIWILRRF